MSASKVSNRLQGLLETLGVGQAQIDRIKEEEGQYLEDTIFYNVTSSEGCRETLDRVTIETVQDCLADMAVGMTELKKFVKYGLKRLIVDYHTRRGGSGSGEATAAPGINVQGSLLFALMCINVRQIYIWY